MRTNVSVLMVLALASCKTAGGGDDQPAGDDEPTGDDEPSIDSAAAPDGPLPVTEEVTCEGFLRTTTAANGSRTEVTSYYGRVDGVQPGDEFVVESCGSVTVPPGGGTSCPAGSTCTGSSTPSGEACYVSSGTGQFWDGVLWINCGYLIEAFDAAGSMTSQSGNTAASVRVTY